MTYDQFFNKATGNAPYGYQCRLACGPDAHPDKPGTLAGGTGRAASSSAFLVNRR